MKRFTSIFFIAFSLSVFQNGCVSACVLCRVDSTSAPLNGSVTKSNIERPKSRNTSFILSIPNTFVVKTRPNNVRNENDLLASIKTAEDLLRVSSQTSLADLSPAAKESIVLITTALYGSMAVPLPPAVAVNLVNMLARSPELFAALPRQCLGSALSILTAANRCALCEVSARDGVHFLHGFLSLSPGVLNTVPRSSFVSILGTAAAGPEALDGLPHASLKNLITALALSKSSFNCLPAPALRSLLTYMASNSPAELLMTLPPSTVFGFLDGLLDTLDGDQSGFAANVVVPTPVLVAVLSPVMTSRMLSVMPIGNIDSLLSVIGSSHALPRALPVSNFVSLFNIFITSPKILSSLNPGGVAKILNAMVTCPSVLDGIPWSLMNQLLDSITVYLPSALSCVPASQLQLLKKK